MKFKDLEFNKREGFICDAGVNAKIFFNNGYGASIIKGFGTYGNEEDLYELAVLKGNKDKWGIVYDTDITDDVIGHLSEKEVEKYLNKIEKIKESNNG